MAIGTKKRTHASLPPRHWQRGFSLLELVGVVSIFGILVAFGYPRLSTLAAIYRLEGAARNLAADLQKTRFRAIAEGTRFQVVFDNTAKTYQVQKETASGTFTNDGAAMSVDDARTLTVSASAAPRFNSRGNVETVTVVTLIARNGATRLVGIQSTGRIYVQ